MRKPSNQLSKQACDKMIPTGTKCANWLITISNDWVKEWTQASQQSLKHAIKYHSVGPVLYSDATNIVIFHFKDGSSCTMTEEYVRHLMY